MRTITGITPATLIVLRMATIFGWRLSAVVGFNNIVEQDQQCYQACNQADVELQIVSRCPFCTRRHQAHAHDSQGPVLDRFQNAI